MRIYFRSLLSACLLAAAVAAALPADVRAADAKQPELPQQGVLSSMSVAGFGPKSTSKPWGFDVDKKTGTISFGSAPLSGNIGRGPRDQWTATVRNNSEDKYTASLSLNQYDLNGTRVRSNPFSVSLEAGQSVSRDFPGANNAAEIRLEVTGWKRFEKKKEGAEQGTSETASAEGTEGQ